MNHGTRIATDSSIFQGDTKYKTELGWFIWLDTTTDNERMVFVNALNGEALVLFNNADVWKTEDRT